MDLLVKADDQRYDDNNTLKKSRLTSVFWQEEEKLQKKKRLAHPTARAYKVRHHGSHHRQRDTHQTLYSNVKLTTKDASTYSIPRTVHEASSPKTTDLPVKDC